MRLQCNDEIIVFHQQEPVMLIETSCCMVSAFIHIRLYVDKIYWIFVDVPLTRIRAVRTSSHVVAYLRYK